MVPPADYPAIDAEVKPGANLANIVKGQKEGAAFLLKAGSYAGFTIAPKEGQEIHGEPGAVMDGGGRLVTAIASSASNWGLYGLTIKRYKGESQKGAIRVGKSCTLDRVTIEDITLSALSKDDADKLKIQRSVFRRIGQSACVGGGGDDVVLGAPADYAGDPKELGNLFEDVNPKRVGTGFNAAAFKHSAQKGLVARGNTVKRCGVNGIWGDVNANAALIADNHFEDVAGNATFWEISFAAKILRNHFLRCGMYASTWGYHAGCLIAHSPDCEVGYNTFEDCRKAISCIQQGREDHKVGPLGRHELKDLWVHHNKVIRPTFIAAGVLAGSDAVWDPFKASANIRFDFNEYVLKSVSAKLWRWKGSTDFKGWQAAGHDKNGTLKAA